MDPVSQMSLNQLQKARRLTLIGNYDRTSTRYNVFAPGSSSPVMIASQPHNSIAEVTYPLTMLGADGRTELGRIDVFWQKFSVFSPDNAQIGTGYRLKVIKLRRRWHLEQTGLPTFIGTMRGIRVLLNIVSYDRNFEGLFFPFRFDFSAPGQAGFRIRRRTGLRSRIRARIDNPLIDRRLVVAQMIAFSRWEQETLRKPWGSRQAPPMPTDQSHDTS